MQIIEQREKLAAVDGVGAVQVESERGRGRVSEEWSELCKERKVRGAGGGLP